MVDFCFASYVWADGHRRRLEEGMELSYVSASALSGIVYCFSGKEEEEEEGIE